MIDGRCRETIAPIQGTQAPRIEMALVSVCLVDLNIGLKDQQDDYSERDAIDHEWIEAAGGEVAEEEADGGKADDERRDDTDHDRGRADALLGGSLKVGKLLEQR